MTLQELLANTQRELDEIKPPFVRDMRQKAPHVFQVVERRRAALIHRYFGRLFVDGQRAEWCEKTAREANDRKSAGDGPGNHEPGEDGRATDDAERRLHRNF